MQRAVDYCSSLLNLLIDDQLPGVRGLVTAFQRERLLAKAVTSPRTPTAGGISVVETRARRLALRSFETHSSRQRTKRYSFLVLSRS